MNREEPATSAEKPPEIGGLLKVFVLLMVFALCVYGFVIWYSFRLLGKLNDVLLVEFDLTSWLVSDVVTVAVLGILMYVGLRMIFLRWRYTPAYWSLLLLAVMAAEFVGLVRLDRFAGEMRPRIPTRAPEALAAFDRQIELGQIGAWMAIGFCFLWALYWQYSKRVSRYFEPSPPTVRPETTPARSFGNRPTRDCPACGTTNLVTGSHCRRCHTEISAAET